MSLLEVKNLQVTFFTASGENKAVNDVSFSLDRGEVIGIVGESGSGKSVTSYSLLQIVAEPGKIVGGSILLDGQELVGLSEKELREIRGKKISIIFQDPMTSLNPLFTIGQQLCEVIMLHTGRNKEEAKARALEMISLVGINDPEKRFTQYPDELSGGMRQRAMIAMALSCEPDLLIADEPTTALDVTIQAQILELMKDLQKKLGMAIIMITHDLGVIAGMCDRVNVMYAGKIVESGSVRDIFYNPKHEYTKGLLTSVPSIDSEEGKRLIPITGSPVDMLALPKGCAFAPRCSKAMKICLEQYPEMEEFNEGHKACCFANVLEKIKNEVKEA